MEDVLFPLGQVVATPGALQMLADAGQEAAEFLTRHATGFWGDVGEEDWQANQDALHHDARIFSVYTLSSGEKLWIITEADRSATTILRPDEY